MPVSTSERRESVVISDATLLELLDLSFKACDEAVDAMMHDA